MKDVCRPHGQVAQGGKVAQGGQAPPKGNQCQRNIRFYTLHGRQEVEKAPDVVIGTLQVFHMMFMPYLIRVQIYLLFLLMCL